MDRYLIAILDDIKPARMRKLKDVREQVVADFKREKSESLARSRAQDFFRAARDAGSLQEVASERSLSVAETDFFKKGATIDDVLKFSPLLHDRVATMKPGEVSPPITVAERQVVFELAARTEIDQKAFEKEKETIAETLRQRQQTQFFSSYLQNTIESMRQENQILINRELLDAITG